MDPVQKFIQCENIARFVQQLQDESDPQERATLRQLLLEEQSRYGFYSDQLELANKYITECQRQIDKQKALVAKAIADGRDAGGAEQRLHNVVDTYDLFVQFRARVSAALGCGPT